jgi:ribosomal protein S18 acetylase RimI-like enzyme
LHARLIVREMEVLDLPPDRFDEAAPVMADAFVDDPGWTAVGPDDTERRRRYIRRVCRGSLAVVARQGGRIWHVQQDGRVAGVLSSLGPGQWPPPHLRSIATQALGPILAGPAVLWRSLSADSTVDAGHPEDPHLFVWMLTVAPDFQRAGVGRALLTHAIGRAEEAGVFTYLNTANPANLPYYASFGFELTGERDLPRGASVWFMNRPG